MNNSSNKSNQILNIFVPLYSLGILLELWYFRISIVGVCMDSCPGSWIQNLGAQFWLTCLMVSIAASILLWRKTSLPFLLSAALYFAVIRTWVICQYEPERIYITWNQAMAFWTFLAFGLSPWLTSLRTVQLLKFLLFFSYFAGGIAKARNGFDWMNGHTMKFYALARHVYLNIPVAWDLFRDVERSKILSWLVVICELSMPVVYFSRRLEWFYVFCLFLFQVACWFLLKLYWLHFFGFSYLIYVSFLIVEILEMCQNRRQKILQF